MKEKDSPKDLIKKNIIVFDIETQKSFKEVGKSRAQGLSKLKVSVVGVYDYLTEKYDTYGEKDMIELDKRFQNADLIIGFNIVFFDLPVLQPYLFTPIEKLPVLDLLHVIEKVRGHRASLDSLAVPTLGIRKSGSGLDAITYFRENKIEELKKYCLDDVRITKGIYEYGYKEKKVSFTSSWDYKTYEIPVDWEKNTQEILNKKNETKTDFPNSLF